MLNTSDPSRTTMVRTRWVSSFRALYRRLELLLKQIVVEEGALGTIPLVGEAVPSVHPWVYLPPAERLREFDLWLSRQLGELNLAGTWMQTAIALAASRGIGQAFTGARLLKLIGGPNQPMPAIMELVTRDKLNFTSEMLRRSTIQERIQAETQRAISDQNAINEQLRATILREAADGLTRRELSSVLLLAMASRIEKTGLRRSKALVDTTVLRTFNECALLALEALGVDRVTASVSNGDNCSACRSWRGKAIPLAQAKGVFPLHPGCHCIFVPIRGPVERS